MDIIIFASDITSRHQLENTVRTNVLHRYHNIQLILSTGEPKQVERYLTRTSALAIFLMVPEQKSFEVTQKIKARKCQSYIIYSGGDVNTWLNRIDQQVVTTAFAVDHEKLTEVIGWCIADQPDDHLILHQGRDVIKIPLREIYCIETVKGAQKLQVIYSGGSFIGARSLSRMKMQLDKRFLQINRYAIVNMDRVIGKHRGRLELENGMNYRYSSRFIKKEAMAQWQL